MVRPPRSFCFLLLFLLHDTRFDSIFGLLDTQGSCDIPSSASPSFSLGPDALGRVLETSFSASSTANTSFGIHSRAETAANRYRVRRGRGGGGEEGGGELDGRNETGRCWFRLAEAAQIGANRFISCNQRRPYVSLSLFSP